MITFFMMHEWTKGKASKWYAYINSLPEDQEFFSDWDPKYLEACQDEQLTKLCQEYALDVDI